MRIWILVSSVIGRLSQILPRPPNTPSPLPETPPPSSLGGREGRSPLPFLLSLSLLFSLLSLLIDTAHVSARYEGVGGLTDERRLVNKLVLQSRTSYSHIVT